MSVVTDVVQLGFGTASSIFSGISQKKADDAKATSLDSQAEYLERKADATQNVMGYKLGQFDEKTGRFLGSQEAATAASGVELSGSSKAARQQSITNMAADRENLWEDYDMQVTELKTKAAITRKAASTQRDITEMNLWSNIMNASGGVAGSVGDIGESEEWW